MTLSNITGLLQFCLKTMEKVLCFTTNQEHQLEQLLLPGTGFSISHNLFGSEIKNNQLQSHQLQIKSSILKKREGKGEKIQISVLWAHATAKVEHFCSTSARGVLLLTLLGSV